MVSNEMEFGWCYLYSLMVNATLVSRVCEGLGDVVLGEGILICLLDHTN